MPKMMELGISLSLNAKIALGKVTQKCSFRRKGNLMIKARCSTNLDNYQGESWPSIFYEVPRIGTRIVSEKGRDLKVVQIYHIEKMEHGEKVPFILIELNK